MTITKQQIIPQFPPSGDARIDGLAKWVYDGLQRLQQKGVLYIDEANIRAVNGVIFPGGTFTDYVPLTNWTPADGSGAGLTLTITEAKMGKAANWVFGYCVLVYPVTASGSTAAISGLTYANALAMNAGSCGATAGTATWVLVSGSKLFPEPPAGGGVTNASLSGATVYINFAYRV